MDPFMDALAGLARGQYPFMNISPDREGVMGDWGGPMGSRPGIRKPFVKMKHGPIHPGSLGVPGRAMRVDPRYPNLPLGQKYPDLMKGQFTEGPLGRFSEQAMTDLAGMRGPSRSAPSDEPLEMDMLESWFKSQPAAKVPRLQEPLPPGEMFSRKVLAQLPDEILDRMFPLHPPIRQEFPEYDMSDPVFPDYPSETLPVASHGSSRSGEISPSFLWARKSGTPVRRFPAIPVTPTSVSGSAGLIVPEGPASSAAAESEAPAATAMARMAGLTSRAMPAISGAAKAFEALPAAAFAYDALGGDPTVQYNVLHKWPLGLMNNPIYSEDANNPSLAGAIRDFGSPEVDAASKISRYHPGFIRRRSGGGNTYLAPDYENPITNTLFQTPERPEMMSDPRMVIGLIQNRLSKINREAPSGPEYVRRLEMLTREIQSLTHLPKPMIAKLYEAVSGGKFAASRDIASQFVPEQA